MTPFQKWLIIILGTFLIIWFFWIQIRPAQIRSTCHSYAKEKANELLKTKAEFLVSDRDKYLEAYNRGMHLKDDYDTIYENCLHKEGLK